MTPTSMATTTESQSPPSRSGNWRKWAFLLVVAAALVTIFTVFITKVAKRALAKRTGEAVG